VSWCAQLLVRADRVSTKLAARTIVADSVGASRAIAGLGVGVFLASGALGVLGAWEHTSQYIVALRSFGPGPQEIAVYGRDFNDSDITSLRDVPGVLGVEPDYLTANCEDQIGCIQVRIGTCADLERSFEVTGCDDSRASAIVLDTSGLAEPFYPGNDEARPRPGATITLDSFQPDTGAFAPKQEITLDGPPITLHVAQQRERWVWDMYDVAFIPERLMGGWWEPNPGVSVLAEGGTVVFERVQAWAQSRGGDADRGLVPADYAQLMQVRAAVITLCGTALGVALLILALGATDRARERRRMVARQLMVGVPDPVLRVSQFIQVIVPACLAVALGLGAGVIGVRGYANLADENSLVSAGSWVGLTALAVAGALIASLVTLPLARPRLTPDLLRRE
jgi:hypothetical protein